MNSAGDQLSPFPTPANAIKALWWYFLLRGLLLLLIAGYMLFRPGLTAVAFAQVLGILFVADGILAGVAALAGRTPSRGWTIARGLLQILVGGFIFAQPILVAGIAVTVVLYVVAFSAILGGVADIAAAVRDRRELKGEGWIILSGVISILFGLLLVMAPLFFGLLIVRILGAAGVVLGIALVIFAFKVRKLAS